MVARVAVLCDVDGGITHPYRATCAVAGLRRSVFQLGGRQRHRRAEPYVSMGAGLLRTGRRQNRQRRGSPTPIGGPSRGPPSHSGVGNFSDQLWGVSGDRPQRDRAAVSRGPGVHPTQPILPVSPRLARSVPDRRERDTALAPGWVPETAPPTARSTAISADLHATSPHRTRAPNVHRAALGGSADRHIRVRSSRTLSDRRSVRHRS